MCTFWHKAFFIKNSLDSIVILTPFLFSCSPLGGAAICQVAINATTDYQDEDQKQEWLQHTADLLCSCLPATLLVQHWRVFREYPIEKWHDERGGYCIWCWRLPTTFIGRYLSSLSHTPERTQDGFTASPSTV